MQSYQEVLNYLFSRLPMFTRIGKAAYKADLTNTIKLMEVLKHPEKKFKTIHIAGTNGKGSTSHMLASILHSAGYKTGLYTSPHIKDFRERIRINGTMISEEYVLKFVELYKDAFEKIEPSFFEWTVALCFDFFSNHHLDIAVIETGLGGRLDSTNIISPLLSVITNIGYDHTDLLGDTIEKIAFEKAGIIKKNTPIIIGQKQNETTNVFEQKANLEHSPIEFTSDIFQIKIWENNGFLITVDVYFKNKLAINKLECDLTGNYQKHNIITVLHAVKSLQENGFVISENHIRTGLKQVKTNTGLKGRWDILSRMPLIVSDTGHNEDGIKEIVEQLLTIKYNKLFIVFGMVNDKLPDKVLSALPKHAIYFFCKADMPRAMNDEDLFEIAKTFGLQGNFYGSVENALNEAKKHASSNDLIFVGGSTFVAAEIL